MGTVWLFTETRGKKIWSVGRRLRQQVEARVLVSHHRELSRSHMEAQF